MILHYINTSNRIIIIIIIISIIIGYKYVTFLSKIHIKNVISMLKKKKHRDIRSEKNRGPVLPARCDFHLLIDSINTVE